MTDEDTGTVAEVSPNEWRDVDNHPDDYAIEGGRDDHLEDIYNEPGEVVVLAEKEG